MTIRILGVHDGHDASAALIVDGMVQYAVEEERITRRKNHWGTPVNAIREVLEQTGTPMDGLDHIALAGTYTVLHSDPAAAILGQYPGQRSPTSALKRRARQILRRNDWVFERYRRKQAGIRESALADLGLNASRMVPVEHHMCHAAASYYSFGQYENPVLVLTCDGSGDRLCGSVSVGRAGILERLEEIPDSESIGRIYGLITYLLGMKPLEHEYKVMGLAPYGGADEDVRSSPVYRSLSAMFEIPRDQPLAWRRRRGVPPVESAAGYVQEILGHERFDRVAAGVQAFVEDLLTSWVRSCIEHTGIRRLALGGGVFMNVKLNQLILAMPEVDELFIMPSCGDESNAIGAALWVHANQDGVGQGTIPKLGPLYWGQEFGDQECLAALESRDFISEVAWAEDPDITSSVAGLIGSGEVVARHAGRMEFGARALGNRSILAPPADRGVVDLINNMIKQRDFWMPFAPSVTAEASERFYSKSKPIDAPYMVITFDSNPESIGEIIAATHPRDGTTRPQEVHKSWNPEYHRIIEKVGEATGSPVVLNTSFNLHGYPIVRSPEDAIDVFDRSGLKHLALGHFMLTKKRG